VPAPVELRSPTRFGTNLALSRDAWGLGTGASYALAGVPYMPSDVNKLSFLNVMLSLVLVIASLYCARAVLIPFALALLRTFLLQPIVAAIHRQGLSRTPAAVLVIVLV